MRAKLFKQRRFFWDFLYSQISWLNRWTERIMKRSLSRGWPPWICQGRITWPVISRLNILEFPRVERRLHVWPAWANVKSCAAENFPQQHASSLWLKIHSYFCSITLAGHVTVVAPHPRDRVEAASVIFVSNGAISERTISLLPAKNWNLICCSGFLFDRRNYHKGRKTWKPILKCDKIQLKGSSPVRSMLISLLTRSRSFRKVLFGSQSFVNW